jgi:uncharacterized membrane protein YczE
MKKSKAARYVVFLIGLFFMSLGICLIAKSDLGTTPISSLTYVLSLKFPISFGTFIFMLCIAFILIEVAILRKDFPREQYLQVLIGPLFGIFIDFGMFIFSSLAPSNYFEKVIILLIGCVVQALGIYMQVAANVLINSGEGVVKIIAMKTRKPFGSIKIIFDFTLVAIAIITSLFAFGSIKGVREGTIISAFLVGYITKIYSRIFSRFERVKVPKNSCHIKSPNNCFLEKNRKPFENHTRTDNQQCDN